ncbi:hypothetical protein TNCT_629271 [Trichonephila clavata]|uniref:Uncharacterized protein n=1 Tax=Trichonephila clavata TaxID=2740835 RepID=A0A8X6IRX3_TRICU|nr:hypothetical protein TNCT_629271 [Trichonephila clavata]
MTQCASSVGPKFKGFYISFPFPSTNVRPTVVLMLFDGCRKTDGCQTRQPKTGSTAVCFQKLTSAPSYSFWGYLSLFFRFGRNEKGGYFWRGQSIIFLLLMDQTYDPEMEFNNNAKWD